MNVIERAVRRVDQVQQRRTPLAFLFGVVKKYGDDNGGVLVANLCYSAFISLFPLLLILVDGPGPDRVGQRGVPPGRARRRGQPGARSSAISSPAA